MPLKRGRSSVRRKVPGDFTGTVSKGPSPEGPFACLSMAEPRAEERLFAAHCTHRGLGRPLSSERSSPAVVDEVARRPWLGRGLGRAPDGVSGPRKGLTGLGRHVLRVGGLLCRSLSELSAHGERTDGLHGVSGDERVTQPRRAVPGCQNDVSQSACGVGHGVASRLDEVACGLTHRNLVAGYMPLPACRVPRSGRGYIATRRPVGRGAAGQPEVPGTTRRQTPADHDPGDGGSTRVRPPSSRSAAANRAKRGAPDPQAGRRAARDIPAGRLPPVQPGIMTARRTHDRTRFRGSVNRRIVARAGSPCGPVARP
jgi:hypothetical protein